MSVEDFLSADYIGQPNTTHPRTMIPWLKIFLGNDARYSQFLCPLADSSGITQYRSTCPLISTPPASSSPSTRPTASPSTRPTTSPSTPASSAPPAGGACSATYRTIGAWSGAYQGEVTVQAGSSAINGWTVRWSLSSGQSITQIWGRTLTTRSTATVRNADWNGSLAASASTTFGFIGSGTPSSPSLTCTSP